MKAERSAPPGLAALKGEGGCERRGARQAEGKGGGKDYIYHRAYVLPSKKGPPPPLSPSPPLLGPPASRDGDKGFGGVVNTARCRVSNTPGLRDEDLRTLLAV